MKKIMIAVALVVAVSLASCAVIVPDPYYAPYHHHHGGPHGYYYR